MARIWATWWAMPHVISRPTRRESECHVRLVKRREEGREGGRE